MTSSQPSSFRSDRTPGPAAVPGLPLRTIEVALASNPYTVWIGDGALEALGALLE